MTSEVAAAPARLRRNSNWKRLWLGQAVSLTGDYVFDVTVMLWITIRIAKGLHWAPAAGAGAVIAASVPALVVGPVAGVFVDRWNRRRTMLAADASRAVLIAALLVLTIPSVAHGLPPIASVAIIYAVVMAASGFAQFFNPSRLAILGLVVAPEDQPKASGLFQATMSFAAIIGPPLAAPLLFVAGVQWALLINAASFVFSFLLIYAMKVPPQEAPDEQEVAGFRAEFGAGLQFFRRSPVLVTIAVGAVVATLGAGCISGLAVFFLIHNLHTLPKWLGTLDGAEGFGAILGALAAGWIAARVGATRVFWAGLVLAGLGIVWFSRTGTLALAIVALGVAGIMIGAINAAIQPLLLGATPQHMLGRVIAVVAPVQYLAGILSLALASFLATTVLAHLHADIAGVRFGTYDTIFGAAGVIIVIAGLASIVPLRGAATQPETPA